MNIFRTIILISALSLLSEYGYGQEQKEIPSTSEIRALLTAAVKRNDVAKTNAELLKMGSSIVPSLIEIIQDVNEDSYVRTGAMGVLSVNKDLRAVEPLIGSLNDKNWLVRDGALFTLEYITRNSFGRDEKAWMKWWSTAKLKYLTSVGDCINPGTKKSSNNQPCWIIEMIAREEMGPPANPPSSISKCVYRNQVVYYEPPRCCDIPSVLWDENGIKICSPDGGESGLGDGKCSDFYREKKDCVIIWKDSRSSR